LEYTATPAVSPVAPDGPGPKRPQAAPASFKCGGGGVVGGFGVAFGFLGLRYMDDTKKDLDLDI